MCSPFTRPGSGFLFVKYSEAGGGTLAVGTIVDDLVWRLSRVGAVHVRARAEVKCLRFLGPFGFASPAAGLGHFFYWISIPATSLFRGGACRYCFSAFGPLRQQQQKGRAERRFNYVLISRLTAGWQHALLSETGEETWVLRRIIFWDAVPQPTRLLRSDLTSACF